MKYKTEY